MNGLTVFDFEEMPVRITDNNGDPWFFLADVCHVLGISNSRQAASRLDEDDKGVTLSDTLAGGQSSTIISESGFYTLVLRAKGAVTPGTVAYRFRKWVTGEVLPSIRKTGRYAPKPNIFDTLSYTEIKLRLDSVREARLAFGKAAAQAAWRAAGLPDVGPATEASHSPASTGDTEFLERFVEACVERVPGSRVQARAMYEAYVRWCRSQSLLPITETAFGRNFPGLGFEKNRGRVRFYLGAKLKIGIVGPNVRGAE